MKKFVFILLLIIFSSAIISHAQLVEVRGIIKDKNGLPIPGATIGLKHKKNKISSNDDGSFVIKASIGQVLQITAHGYISKNITLQTTNTTIVLLPANIDLQEVVTVGSRRANRVKTESAVPIDIIKFSDVGINTARTDLSSTLNYAAPSFNYNKQSGSDGADHIDIGTLRGLGPDQTLVLINGSRRHQTAFVALFGTRGRGNSGVDLSAFPSSIVDNLEILRDGASAQYGSDAIAGVININLKKSINVWEINTGVSSYFDGTNNSSFNNANNDYYTGGKFDGVTVNLNINHGWALGKNGGFINVSLDLLNQGKTYRQANIKDSLPVNVGRRAFGDASLTTVGTFYNMEIPLSKSKKTTFYSFGGYNNKSSDAFAYTRQWDAKPDRFPVDAAGNLIFVSDIMRKTLDGKTIYYNPHIQTIIQDASIATGLKGVTNNDWNWDLTNILGFNDFHFYGDKTFNSSIIGRAFPTNFDDGGFNFLQNTTNIDFSKSFGTNNQEGNVNLAFGGEWRQEKYTIYKGEEGSYIAYPNNLGLTQAPGAQGFPGFSPSDVFNANRNTLGAYIDVEWNIVQKWLVNGAVRAENYSDFGSVVTYKFATRYKILDNLNVRGSFSSGYRAPSLQQINFSNTLTSFSDGKLVQSRIANNNDNLTKLAGMPVLKQETSNNFSIGFSYKPIKDLTLTVDYYKIIMKDRLVLSGLLSATDDALPTNFTNELKNLGVSTAQFFTNAVNTTNAGIDIVIDYRKKINNTESIKALLTGNFQQITIDKINIPNFFNASEYLKQAFFSDREIAFLKASAPDLKLSFNVDYTVDRFNIGARVTYFGKIVLTGFGYNGDGINPMVPADIQPVNQDPENPVLVPEIFNYNPKAVVDIYASEKINKNIKLIIGADNLFNTHPDLGVNPAAKGWAGDNESGGPWDAVQMGFNGLRLFTKLVFTL